MITIKTLVFNNLSVNTYVLHDQTNRAVIIDPACSNSGEHRILYQYIDNNKLNPEKIINTHGHIDHIVGVEKVMKNYNIPFFIHPDDNYLLSKAKEMGFIFGFQVDEIPSASAFLNEGDIIEFGNSSLKVMHIPGHSPGSIVFYSESDNFVIVGDVLFRGSIGRTDLPLGDYETLINGIKNKLLTLPRGTVVYSGHGPSTTIKTEHDTNPFLV
jgi:glyoxylase-like metal-dependent hydrolase (beta-lactamase superfamily II)